ncbi:hypothetical protein GCM10009872_18530 [Actinopolymorpha rutila]
MATWQVLLALKTRPTANQRELAAAVGIQGATLTHHLNGLLTRRRDPANRRVHLVELTDEGEAAFRRLRDVAVAHDRRFRADIGVAYATFRDGGRGAAGPTTRAERIRGGRGCPCGRASLCGGR